MKKGLSKKQKTIGIYSLCGLVLVLASGVGTQQYMHTRMVKMQELHDQQMAAKDAELNRYKQQSVQTFTVAKADGLKSGSVITEADIKPVALPDYFVPKGDQFVTKKEDLVGRTVKLDTPANSYFLSSMIYQDGKLDPSARKREVDFIRLPYKLQQGEKVDIRIAFPDGTDYIVIPKKKMDEVDLPAQMIYFNSNEDETLLLNSALVDAYLNLGEIYIYRYADAEMQEKPAVTYIPRVEVLRLMQSDPQIVEKARWENLNSVRSTMDQTLKSLNPADLKIKDGFKRLESSLPENSGVAARKQTQKPGPSVQPTTPPANGTGATATTPPAAGTGAGAPATPPPPDAGTGSQATQPQANNAPAGAPPNTFGG